jgi:hypothetical protein
MNKIDQYIDDIFMVVLTSPIWITVGVGAYAVMAMLYNWILG